ncbi:protein PXR1-like [Cryptomeria japonica]|uniref:protein PXR1-like n=1 Tax=Cryptomeria japonica TaxID=3369 RepID=UPI0027DA14AF|nr:protein PXR1-like [Cryptomeria japonica]
MILIYDHIKANQIARPQLSVSESEEEGSDSEFYMGEDFAGDLKSETEESLKDSKVELGKKRKQESSNSSSSKGKKKRKEKKRKKQKRQDNSELETEDKEQRKDSDADQKVEEEITGDGFNQSVGGDVEQNTGGEDPKTDQAKS